VVGFYELLKNLIFNATLLPGVVGPVGIFTVAQETGKVGIIYLFELISLISINLAVVNLIPFPALDGGRFFIILVEKLKGSPISRRTEAAINAVGFVFLIFLMVVITIRDIVNL
jgi:regulator of sigma E protease